MEKPETIIKDIENYLAAQRVDKLVKDLVVSVLHNKPESIHEHMIKQLLIKTKEAEGEVALSSTEDGVHVAFAHTDAGSHKYLISAGVHELFAELLQRLAEEKPEDVAGFIVQHLSAQ